MNKLSPFIARPIKKRGFTLVEVMLSVALMIILLAGVNYIFSTSADAVSAGQAIGGMDRQDRNAQPVLFNDIYTIAKDPPFFIIESRGRIQYLNAADQLTSPLPEVWVTDNAGTIQNVNPVLYGSRAHRVDVLQFFAHTNYQRRSADDGFYSNFTFGNDIYVHIGHGAMPSNDLTAYYGPEDPQAPITIPPSVAGAYASDWTLLRTAILLKDPNNLTLDYNSPPASAETANYGGPWNFEVNYPRQPNGPALHPTALSNAVWPTTTQISTWPGLYLANLTPFSWYIPDTSTTGSYIVGSGTLPATSFFGDSRYDIAGITLEQMREVCADAIHQQNTNSPAQNSRFPLWCPRPVLYSCPYTTGIGDPIVVSSTAPWQWDWRKSATSKDSIYPINNRFHCNPFIPAPLTSGGVAQASPFFAQHCSQFIVEYAGDYLAQETNGTIDSAQPDGQIDFYIDSTSQKHVRWYGFPRKTSPATVAGIRGFKPGDTLANSNAYQDVIPLSDYLCLLNGGLVGSSPNQQRILASQEVDCNFLPPTTTGDYTTDPTIIANTTANQGKDSRYACAWYNNTPSMIRVLMKVDDPNNRVQDGPWFEYIFKLK